LDSYQYKEIHLILQKCKSQLDKYSKTFNPKFKIKQIKEKSLLQNKKKFEGKICLSANNILIKPPMNKPTEESNLNTIRWDYSLMIKNIQFCSIPRFLIVEVKFIESID